MWGLEDEEEDDEDEDEVARDICDDFAGVASVATTTVGGRLMVKL